MIKYIIKLTTKWIKLNAEYHSVHLTISINSINFLLYIGENKLVYSKHTHIDQKGKSNRKCISFWKLFGFAALWWWLLLSVCCCCEFYFLHVTHWVFCYRLRISIGEYCALFRYYFFFVFEKIHLSFCMIIFFARMCAFSFNIQLNQHGPKFRVEYEKNLSHFNMRKRKNKHKPNETKPKQTENAFTF